MIRAQTEHLRTSPEEHAVRLRSLLLERNVDPAEALLAAGWPDDSHLDLGYLVTAKGQVFLYEFDTEEGRMRKWIQLSAINKELRKKTSPQELEAIRRALRMLGHGPRRKAGKAGESG